MFTLLDIGQYFSTKGIGEQRCQIVRMKWCRVRVVVCDQSTGIFFSVAISPGALHFMTMASNSVLQVLRNVEI